MLYFLLSLLVVLQQTVKGVDEKSLDQMYEDFKTKHSSCTLIDQKTDDHFQELCKDKTSPKAEIDPEKIEKFQFDFLPYLCYTVLHNLRSACSHSQQNFTEFAPKEDPSQFCTNPAQINIKENCADWLEDQTKAHSDCALVSKVVGVVLSSKTCHDYCIKQDKIDPLCQDLVRSSVILADLSNRSQPTGPLTPPGLTKGTGSTATAEQKPEETQKTEETKETTITTSASSSTTNNAPPVAPVVKTETKQTEDEGEGKDTKGKGKEETVEEKDVKKENKVEEKSAAAEEKETEIIEASDTNSPTVSVTDPPKEEIEAEVEKVSAQQKQISSGVISEDSNSEAQSNFFSYFILLSIVAILAYLVFHNKQKVSEEGLLLFPFCDKTVTIFPQILALILEGRRHQGSRRRSGGREYRKLDSSLEVRPNYAMLHYYSYSLFPGHHGVRTRGKS